MRALEKRARGPGTVELVEKPGPRPGPGEVVLKVLGAGICGTDLHIVDDEYTSFPPVTLGHEVCGAVTDLGPSVDEDWLGARVVCETFHSTCRSCAWCLAGRPNLCPERKSIGSGVDGGFAESLALPARNLHRVPQSLNDHAASLSEPLACVVNCLCDPSVISPGDDVLVIGPGPVGLLAAQIARAAGGGVLVVGTDRDEVRLRAARELGFATALSIGPDPIPAIADGQGFDVSIECSGSSAGIAMALQSVRRAGRHVQIGIVGKPTTIPVHEICYRELIVTSGFASTPTSWRRAMVLVENGSVQLEPLVTEWFPSQSGSTLSRRRGQGTS